MKNKKTNCQFLRFFSLGAISTILQGHEYNQQICQPASLIHYRGIPIGWMGQDTATRADGKTGTKRVK
jgi:hypothetical protein